MKYIVILGDGMADEPLDSLNGKTPLEAANKPYMDRFAKIGTMGMIRTVYENMSPGSDIANLTVMGFDASKNYTGRSPLEAASIGVDLSDTDITYRVNTVTLSDEEPFENKIMIDYSAGEIETDEAKELISFASEKLKDEIFSFYSGVSYRHLLLRKDGIKAGRLVPPHDILGKTIKDYLPYDEKLLDIMKKSYDLLKDHPINIKRIKEGKNPANSFWIWGEGTKPELKSYEEMFGLKGAVISAVDLIKGIGYLAGLKVINVPGATGNINTDFLGKAEAAINELKTDSEFIYIHIEAPDESGHQGNLSDKIRSIEEIDEKVIKPIYDYLKSENISFKMLILPDHPTPVKIRTHTNKPVPFLLIKDTDDSIKNDSLIYSEKDAVSTGIYLDRGHLLLSKIIKGEL